jgi:hypothetical protein
MTGGLPFTLSVLSLGSSLRIRLVQVMEVDDNVFWSDGGLEG